MACSDCSKTKPITTCGEEIIIQESFPAGLYDIYIVDNTINKTYKQLVSVANDGETLAIDLERFDLSIFMPDHDFSIFVTEHNAGIGAKEDLTFGEGSAAIVTDCLSVPFVRVYDESDEPYPISSQIIELE